MRRLSAIPAILFMLICTISACTGGGKTGEKDSKPPDVVVTEFLSLLADGGRLSNKEAQKMVSSKYTVIDPDTFRKWTRGYTKDSKVTVVKTLQGDRKTKDGDSLVIVKLRVESPSMFGDPFISSSSINLIFDKELGAWKIDFLAQTLDESGFRKSSDTAGPKPEGGGK